MMSASELLDLISGGETSAVQFKENIKNETSLAQEIAAFANSEGGCILIGVNDQTGATTGLTFDDLRRLGQIISNAASELVKPSISVRTETIDVNGSKVLAIQVPKGIYPPYRDNSGAIFTKNGSDKRRVNSNEELLRLLERGSMVSADKMPLPDSSARDLDIDRFEAFFEKKFGTPVQEASLPLESLLQNLNLAKDGQLTLAGAVLFAKDPASLRSDLTVRAVAFAGNDLAGTTYRDSEDIAGDLETVFQKCMGFLKRNLRYTQQGQNFNSIGKLEIAEIALEELVVNALLHRDYFKNDFIQLLIFDDRVEIVSPGRLPNGLTENSIRFGNIAIRNNTLVSSGTYVLPYRGLGTGVPRTLAAHPGTAFFNDIEGDQFQVVLPRP